MKILTIKKNTKKLDLCGVLFSKVRYNFFHLILFMICNINNNMNDNMIWW